MTLHVRDFTVGAALVLAACSPAPPVTGSQAPLATPPTPTAPLAQEQVHPTYDPLLAEIGQRLGEQLPSGQWSTATESDLPVDVKPSDCYRALGSIRGRLDPQGKDSVVFDRTLSDVADAHGFTWASQTQRGPQVAMRRADPHGALLQTLSGTSSGMVEVFYPTSNTCL